MAAGTTDPRLLQRSSGPDPSTSSPGPSPSPTFGDAGGGSGFSEGGEFQETQAPAPPPNEVRNPPQTLIDAGEVERELNEIGEDVERRIAELTPRWPPIVSFFPGGASAQLGLSDFGVQRGGKFGVPF